MSRDFFQVDFVIDFMKGISQNVVQLNRGSLFTCDTFVTHEVKFQWYDVLGGYG